MAVADIPSFPGTPPMEAPMPIDPKPPSSPPEVPQPNDPAAKPTPPEFPDEENPKEDSEFDPFDEGDFPV